MATAEELANRLSGVGTSKQEEEQEQSNIASEHAQSFNYGLSNVLGAPVDIANIPVGSDRPYMGSQHIRQMMSQFGMLPEDPETRREGATHRGARLLGETAVPFAGMMAKGKALAKVSPTQFSEFEKALLTMYQHRYRTLGAESLAVAGGTAGGEMADAMYPENKTAEVLGELLGGAGVGFGINMLKYFGTRLPTFETVKNTFSEGGAKIRASKRMTDQAADIDSALRGIMTESELDLDPATLSGDQGVMSLFKAAMKKDHKLLGEIENATEQSMKLAAAKVKGTGNPQAAIDFLKALRIKTVAKAQKYLTKAGSDVTPVKASRELRSSLEDSLKQSEKVEDYLWGKLPTESPTNINGTIGGWEDSLRARRVTDDPGDIPSFIEHFLGKVNNKGKFVKGKLKPDSPLGDLTVLRSRINSEIRKERALDVPNFKKISLLGDIQSNLLDDLEAASTDYAAAINHTRQQKQMFNQGRIGKLLGFKRTGEMRVTSEGSLDFMLSGNQDDIRKGIRGLREASPESFDKFSRGVRSTFASQVAPDGYVNPIKAKQFMKNNQTVLDEIPELRGQFDKAIVGQADVDSWFGATKPGEFSVAQKEKSAAALYLNGRPDEAMHNVITARNDAGQGSLMRELISMTNLDETGEATKGLQTAFGDYLLKASHSADYGFFSGRKFLDNLNDMKPAAKELFGAEDVKRMQRIGTELRLIENRSRVRAAEGGVISDMPNKIIQIIGGTFAARAGAKAGAGTSGASLRTASIFTKEFNTVLGRLTNDGAEELLIKSMQDGKLFKTLLSRPTPQTAKELSKLMSSYNIGQYVTAPQELQSQSPVVKEERSLAERLQGIQ